MVLRLLLRQQNARPWYLYEEGVPSQDEAESGDANRSMAVRCTDHEFPKE